MRKEVIGLLQDKSLKENEQFNRALEIYRRSPGHNARVMQSMNTQGYSKARLDSLVYELKKLHAIQERELIKKIEDIAVVNSEEVIVSAEGGADKGNPVSDATAAAVKSEHARVVQVFSEAPEEVKAEIKLRDEFPFLKNDDCPNELKILVTDKFNHYDKYVESRKNLMVLVFPNEEGLGQKITVLDDAEIFEFAKTAVENFILNQEIYTELEVYRNTGKIHGEHPLLKMLKLEQSIEGKSSKDLNKRKSNLINYRNRDTKKAEEATDPQEKSKLEGKVKDWEQELGLVEAAIIKLDSAK